MPNDKMCGCGCKGNTDERIEDVIAEELEEATKLAALLAGLASGESIDGVRASGSACIHFAARSLAATMLVPVLVMARLQQTNMFHGLPGISDQVADVIRRMSIEGRLPSFDVVRCRVLTEVPGDAMSKGPLN